MRQTITPGGTNYLAGSEGEEYRRVWLFELFVPEVTLYFAQAVEDVEYRGHTYVAYPIQHEGISENTQGRVDQISLDIGNLTTDISAILEANNALRGCQVNMIDVRNLEDDDACIVDTYYVDSVNVKLPGAKFVLAPKYDVMEAGIASRLYGRTFCSWEYKCRGCWLTNDSGDFVAPPDFDPGDPDTCRKDATDCRRHNNMKRIGSFPSIPTNTIVHV